jgi:hypothetical protein
LRHWDACDLAFAFSHLYTFFLHLPDELTPEIVALTAAAHLGLAHGTVGNLLGKQLRNTREEGEQELASGLLCVRSELDSRSRPSSGVETHCLNSATSVAVGVAWLTSLASE